MVEFDLMAKYECINIHKLLKVNLVFEQLLPLLTWIRFL